MTALPTPATSPDYVASLDFLKFIQPLGPWCLCSQKADKSNAFTGRRFTPDEAEVCREWIADQNADGNQIWYRAAAVQAGVNAKVAGDQHIIGTRLAWVDIDPDPDRDRDAQRVGIFRQLTTALPTGVKPPTLIIDSGNGLQALWVFREPWKFADDAEREDFRAINRWLANRFNADKCFAPNHLLRLPGTTNWKRKAGDAFPVASVVKSDGPTGFGPNDFERVKDSKRQGTDDAPQQADVPARCFADDASDIPVSERMRAIVFHGYDPLAPTEHGGSLNVTTGEYSGSLNEFQFGVTIAMLEAVKAGKMTEADVRGVLIDPRYGVSRSILTKGNGSGKRAPRPDWQKYLDRQIKKAREETNAKALKEQNTGNGFITNDMGRIALNLHNMRLALGKLGMSIRLDDFADVLVQHGLPSAFDRILDDKGANWIEVEFAERFGWHIAKEDFDKYILRHAIDNRFNPVIDYFDARQKEWDGTPRIGSWLIDHAGAEGTPLTCEIGKLVLIAAVRRARHPGSKWDEMVVLESPEGMNKSTGLRLLTPGEEWFTDDFPLDVDTKRQMEALENKLIVECGELKGLRRAEVGALKSLLSRTEDRARMSYGRRNTTRKRRCVFFGTTNESKYLASITGNRRFWPIPVRKFNLETLKANKAQLWAEAATLESQWAGDVRLDPKFYADAAKEQDQRMDTNVWWELLAPLFEDKSVFGKIQTTFVWAVIGKANPRLRTQTDKTLLGECMRKMGWENKQLKVLGMPESCYARGSEAERSQLLWLDKRSDGWHVCGIPEGYSKADYQSQLELYAKYDPSKD